MDFQESSKSSWFGRYSWGDENQVTEGLHLDGSSIVTNVEQYVGSNTRMISPTVVTETRFGYTRFYNSAGRLLAFTRNVVDELKIPGLAGRPAGTVGHPQRNADQLQQHRRRYRRSVREQEQLDAVPQQHLDYPRQAHPPLRRRNPPRPVQPGGQPVRARPVDVRSAGHAESAHQDGRRFFRRFPAGPTLPGRGGGLDRPGGVPLQPLRPLHRRHLEGEPRS